MPLAQVLKAWRLPSGAFPALMTALSAGEIGGFEAVQRDVPLGKMRIPAQPLKAWLSQWKVRHLGSMSITAAAQALGLKEQVTYELVRAGLLQSHAPDNGSARRVTVEAIRQFQMTYVAATEVSRAIGTSPKALLTTTTVQPVTGPTIDGCRQYFFNQSDVEHLLAMGASSPNAGSSPHPKQRRRPYEKQAH